MKKLLLIASVATLTMLYACSGVAKVETTAAATESKVEEAKKVIETTKKVVEEKKENSKSVNKMTEREFSFDASKDFSYTGNDKCLKTITDDMVAYAKEMFGKQGAVEIPTPYIVKIDDSDKNDIKYYGDFWIYGYDMYGTVFNMKNGGANPGCYHLKDDNGNITVVSKEFAEDGSNNWSSLVKICGGDESFAKEVSNARDNDEKKNDDKVRKEYAKMYADANKLRLSGIKDFGWPIILFSDIDDAEFAYNFFNSYFGEIRDDNSSRDMVDRLEGLKEKYFTKELLDKISDLTLDKGADMVINAQDATDEMVDTLEAVNMGDGNVKVNFDQSGNKVTANVKLENKNGKKMFADISYE